MYLQEGEDLIQEFMTKVKELPHTGLTTEQFVDKIKTFKESLSDKDNYYVKDVLARGKRKITT